MARAATAQDSMRGKVVVITGASSGNGRAAALRFAREGASLVLAARRGEVLAQAVAECEAAGGSAVEVVADVSDCEAVEAISVRAIEAFGGFDVWINNAGVIQFGRLDATPMNVLRRVIEVNLLGCMHGAQVALRHFRNRTRGTLLNVSSLLGVVGQPYAAAYVASKFGVRGLSEALRQENADLPDIHVCTLLPAAIDTPIYQHGANYTGHDIAPPPPVHDVEVVADAMLALVQRPRREAYAGGIGHLVGWQKALAPGLAEWMSSAVVQGTELRDRIAADTDGNLFRPARDDWSLRGGWLQR